MPDINGTSGNDIITESSGFSGGTPGAENDTITGLGGDDVIAGGEGNDLLIGDTAEARYVETTARPTPPSPSERYGYADFDGDGDIDYVRGGYNGWDGAGASLAFRNEGNGVYTEMDGLDGRPDSPFPGLGHKLIKGIPLASEL